MTVCVVVCFFSSRRRHTRCLSDWSSDVCSSDLWPVHAGRLVRVRHGVFVPRDRDRKSTRLNSSHLGISYAVFCLKKKQKKYNRLVRVVLTVRCGSACRAVLLR